MFDVTRTASGYLHRGESYKSSRLTIEIEFPRRESISEKLHIGALVKTDVTKERFLYYEILVNRIEYRVTKAKCTCGLLKPDDE